MEEASLASALGLDSKSDAKTARRLVQLQAGAFQGESLGSQEVGPTAYPDSYYLILDMNGRRGRRRMVVTSSTHLGKT